MSTLPSSVTEATTRRASFLPTYFASRVIVAFLVTGLDVFVFLKYVLDVLRDPASNPLIRLLLVYLLGMMAVPLGDIWYKTLRYRQPSRPNSRNPFL